jgi:hypothetical protein
MAIIALSAGCAAPSWFRSAPVQPAENPLFVAATDREFLWNTLVDTVDDYFKVQREERVRLVGGVLTEGRIDTFYAPGSTYLEPWRHDSTPGYEKHHATLQSIRRRATLRVMPAPGGYLVEAIVDKELEDLDRPEQATAGQSTLRHDGTIVRIQGQVQGSPIQLGWIPLGRDASLEQRILLELRSKFANPGNVSAPLPAEVNQGAYLDIE